MRGRDTVASYDEGARTRRRPHVRIIKKRPSSTVRWKSSEPNKEDQNPRPERHRLKSLDGERRAARGCHPLSLIRPRERPPWTRRGRGCASASSPCAFPCPAKTRLRCVLMRPGHRSFAASMGAWAGRTARTPARRRDRRFLLFHVASFAHAPRRCRASRPSRATQLHPRFPARSVSFCASQPAVRRSWPVAPTREPSDVSTPDGQGCGRGRGRDAAVAIHASMDTIREWPVPVFGLSVCPSLFYFLM